MSDKITTLDSVLLVVDRLTQQTRNNPHYGKLPSAGPKALNYQTEVGNLLILQLNHKLKHSVTDAGVTSGITMEWIDLSMTVTINVRWSLRKSQGPHNWRLLHSY